MLCYSTNLNNSEGNKEKIYFGNDLCALILRLGFEYVGSPFGSSVLPVLKFNQKWLQYLNAN